MSSRWLRIAGWVVAGVVGVLAIRALVRQWHELLHQPVTWQVRPLNLAEESDSSNGD